MRQDDGDNVAEVDEARTSLTDDVGMEGGCQTLGDALTRRGGAAIDEHRHSAGKGLLGFALDQTIVDTEHRAPPLDGEFDGELMASSRPSCRDRPGACRSYWTRADRGSARSRLRIQRGQRKHRWLWGCRQALALDKPQE